jgi:Fic family protein
MFIPAKYVLTAEISRLLASIEASKEVIEEIVIPVEIENNIRRKSTLSSSLFSARIEGNTLTLEDMPAAPSKVQKKAEVYNLLKAINWLKEKNKKDVTVTDILSYHKIAMEGLVESENLGKFRKNPEAIFNSAGIAVFMAPPASRILPLITRLIKFANGNRETSVPIRACLAHYTFERIHPFLDGSGRVGRLLLQKILLQGGYGMKGLLPLEEYLDNHRTIYYHALESPERDVTDYLEFMLTAIAETAKNARELISEKQKADVTDFLLPRRAEIYNIIKDHRMVNFDSLRRRFMAVNERTLRYDLKQLQDRGLIKKLGTTKGVYYRVSN